jgi:outer membrane biosynthesis protein TonB
VKPSPLPIRPAEFTRNARAAMLLLLCAISLVGLGCHKRTVQAAPPVSNPAPPSDTTPPPTTEPKPTPPPETPPAPTPEPPTLVVPTPKPTPVKPHPTPVEPPPPTPKPDAPQISPQLTPAEQAEAERQTKKDIDTSENNLQVAYGKQLNATQHDLMEKIRGFLGQSREAIRASDWVRAKNLAQKARVLSVELLKSL